MPPGIIFKYAKNTGIDASAEVQLMELMGMTFESTNASPGFTLCRRALEVALCCLTRCSQTPNFLRDMITQYPTVFDGFVSWILHDAHGTREGLATLEKRLATCSCEGMTGGAVSFLHELDVTTLVSPGVLPPTLATEVFILLTRLVERCDKDFMKELKLCQKGKHTLTPTRLAYISLHKHLTGNIQGIVQTTFVWYEKWKPLDAIQLIRAIYKIHPSSKNFGSVLANFPQFPPIMASSAIFFARGACQSSKSFPHYLVHSYFLWHQLYLFSKAMRPQDRTEFLRPGATTVYKSAGELLDMMKQMSKNNAELIRSQTLPWVVKTAELVHSLADVEEVGRYDFRFPQFLHLPQRDTLTFTTPYLSLWRCMHILLGVRRCFNTKCDNPNAHQTLKSCARCKFAVYCSRKCQLAGWKDTTDVAHKLLCKDWTTIASFWPSALDEFTKEQVQRGDNKAAWRITGKVEPQTLNKSLADTANSNGFNKRRIRNVLKLSLAFWLGLSVQPGLFRGVEDVGSDTESEIDYDDWRDEDGQIDKEKILDTLRGLDLDDGGSEWEDVDSDEEGDWESDGNDL